MPACGPVVAGKLHAWTLDGECGRSATVSVANAKTDAAATMRAVRLDSFVIAPFELV